jgi:ABC-2 type transport system permease protein
MYKLRATIWKDITILTRDRVGVIFMFAMPVILAIVITATQNSTFELVNNNRINLLICNRDTGVQAKEFEQGIEKAGMFRITKAEKNINDAALHALMDKNDALVTIEIPADFSTKLKSKADATAASAIRDFGLDASDSTKKTDSLPPVKMLYNPVMQAAFRQSIQGALQAALQMVQTRAVLQSLYYGINNTPLPDSVDQEILKNKSRIEEIPVNKSGRASIPNATQHNIPAWTIFAMFFVVISLGSSVVREKNSGSFLRLKTLPTNYSIALISKQLTYLLVTLLQAFLIFFIGICLFPKLGLPALRLPADLLGLFLVTLSCGVCAVSYAICIGVYAQTQEQANGIGAVSIVLLAALGGLLVPSFAMPASFENLIKISPLHWALEGFYNVFLEDGKMKDIMLNLLPLWAITILLQLISFAGLKKKNLV